MLPDEEPSNLHGLSIKKMVVLARARGFSGFDLYCGAQILAAQHTLFYTLFFLSHCCCTRFWAVRARVNSVPRRDCLLRAIRLARRS